MSLLNNIEAKLMKGCIAKGRWLPCDQLAAAALIEPEFMAETGDYHVTVELSGKHTRGLMVVDYPNLIGQPNNVRLVKRINQDLFEKLLIWGVGGPMYK
jgi:inosine-uridine nucleoside N-ribohydrolase